MKTMTFLFITAIAATPAFAADQGYVEATGGVQASSVATFGGSTTSNSGGIQLGLRVAPHLFVVGEAGRFRSLQPAADQSALDGTVSNLSSSYGVDLTGEASQKASYGFGGVRIQGSTGHHVTPYAMAGLGMAHVVQTATLTYTDGTLPGVDPSATAPDPGADVTAQLVSTGVFAQSSPENALMFSTSAGVAIDLARHITADVGYRFSHIGTTAPITAQGVAFGVGVRF